MLVELEKYSGEKEESRVNAFARIAESPEVKKVIIALA